MHSPADCRMSLSGALLLSLFTQCIDSRHVHRRHIHNHLHRVETTPFNTVTAATTALPSSPLLSNSGTVPAEPEEIVNNTQTLLADAFRFSLEIERRLSDIERLLDKIATRSLSSSIPPTTPTGTMGVMSMTASALAATTTSIMSYGQAGPLSLSSISGYGNLSAPYMNGTGYHSPSLASSTTTYPMQAGKTFSAFYTTDITTTITISGSAEVVTSAVATYSLQAAPPAYTFNPAASDNLAVYYGQTPNTEAGGLIKLCEQEDVDIVIISFLMDFFANESMPAISFGPACDPPNTAQSEQAPGLLDCPALATQVSGCQAIGKKVMLSLGGYLANTSFVSDNQAEHFAETLWNLFGAGRDNLDIRPFGPDVVLDGFDIDNENHDTSHYNAFATALKAQYKKDTNKDYYLSAAPQCPIPDESIPLGAMKQADFVWVQFYNNPICNLNSTGFQDSFSAWSKQLMSNGTTPGPRLYIGAPGFAGAGSGYTNGSQFGGIVQQARSLNVSNFGGVMLWDGSEGTANIDEYGVSYLDYAKAAVQ